MKNNNTFQLVVIIVFGVFAVLGVFLFATQGGNNADAFSLEVWGTQDSKLMNDLIINTFPVNDPLEVSYRQINEGDFDSVLVEALAEDSGPDAVILSQDRILRHEEKALIIPYESFSERNFRDTFLTGSEIFLRKDGVLGIPFIIDPIVMYWNRSLFANARVVEPPKYWDEFAKIVPKITKTDFSGNVLKAAIAFGEFNNVSNAKKILSTLFIQAGTPIIFRSETGLVNVLNSQLGQKLQPAQTALRFYTEFADPVKPNYSWNRSLPNSKKAFLSGDLGMYFGFASELDELRKANPNLNFDVALFPQIRDTEIEATNANFYAFVVMKRTKNVGAVLNAISRMSNKKALQFILDNTGLPPVSRTLLNEKPTDAYKSVFYDSALISTSWLDPSPVETDEIFRNMIEDVTSGRLRISSSISRASQSLDRLLKNR